MLATFLTLVWCTFCICLMLERIRQAVLSLGRTAKPDTEAPEAGPVNPMLYTKLSERVRAEDEAAERAAAENG